MDQEPMFAIIEPGGNKAAYVPGLFRQRKVSKVEKIPMARSVGKEMERLPVEGTDKSVSFQAKQYEERQSGEQSSLGTLQAKDIMSSPVFTLPMTASLTETWEIVQARRFRHIPILAQDGMVVGILSDRDLARGTVESALAGVKGSIYLEQISIQSYVSSPVLVSNPEAAIWAMAKVLLEERIGAMPVVSAEGSLLGIITRTDILRALVAHPNCDRWV